MKSIGKAPEFLRKAVGALRGKAGVLRARLLFLASLRRRTAVVAGISRHIRALSPGWQGRKKAAVQCRGRPIAPVEDADDNHVVVGLPELARQLFQEVDGDGDGGYTDWTLKLHTLFEEEDEHRAAGLAVVDGVDDDEPSVIDVIRSRREGDGQEFRIEDEIDQAADMFSARVRRRMSTQPELVATGFL